MRVASILLAILLCLVFAVSAFTQDVEYIGSTLWSNVHDVKGFGLGLYYVKYICFIHKWKIHLESNLNEGSCFEIIMPLS